MIFTIEDALTSLYPEAEWVLRGGTYEGLEWLDTKVSKPSEYIIKSEINRLHSVYVATEYQRKRAAEYPDFKEYLDGIVKGDPQQVQAYIDKCLAVKAKYPKAN